jgi:hypothetical protein
VRLFRKEFYIYSMQTAVTMAQPLKVNIRTLVTVANYAEKTKTPRRTVYQMIKDGKLEPVIIDGVLFLPYPEKQ